MSEIFALSWQGISLGSALLALGVVMVTWLVLHWGFAQIIGWLKRLAGRTTTTLDDVIIEFLGQLKWPLIIIITFVELITLLNLPDFLESLLGHSLTIIIAVIVILLINTLIGTVAAAVRKSLKKRGNTNIIIFAKILKIFVWALGALFILDNFNVDITGLIAGLGIGGLAVALAAQNVLSDVFASISISVDEPFVPGDFIEVDGITGTVENIGIKSTRIRSLSGPLVSLPNSKLMNSHIHNYTQSQRRRGVVAVGIEYDTDPEIVEKIPAMLEKMTKGKKTMEFVRAKFTSFGDSSLNFELVFDSLAADYDTLADNVQMLQFTIYREFTKQKIAFAFPTQTIHLVKN